MDNIEYPGQYSVPDVKHKPSTASKHRRSKTIGPILLLNTIGIVVWLKFIFSYYDNIYFFAEDFISLFIGFGFFVIFVAALPFALIANIIPIKKLRRYITTSLIAASVYTLAYLFLYFLVAAAFWISVEVGGF